MWWIESSYPDKYESMSVSNDIDNFSDKNDNSFNTLHDELKSIREKETREVIIEAISSIWLTNEENQELVSIILKDFIGYNKVLSELLDDIWSDWDISTKEDVLDKIKKYKKIKEIEDKNEKIEDEKEENENDKEEHENKEKESEQKVEKRDNNNSITYNLNLLRNITSNIDITKSEKGWYKFFIDYLKEWDFSNPEKTKEIIDRLKSDQSVFDAIIKDIPKESYSDFKTAIIWLDNNSLEIIRMFDKAELDMIPDLWASILWTTNLEWVIYSWNEVIKTDNWFNVFWWKIDWKYYRAQSVEWSDYRLKSSVDEGFVDKIWDIKREALKEISSLNKPLKEILTFLNYIDTAISENLDIAEVKESIKLSNPELYNNLWLDSVWDLDSMRYLLTDKKSIIEEQKQTIIDEANEQTQKLLDENAQKLKEKDEKTRDTLRFLSSIWFDEIPQSVTDMIIETLNSSSTLANSLWFTTKINLEEGLLWTDTNMDNKKDSLWEKVKFAKFVNILISWSEDIPLNINNLKADSGVAIDDITLFRASLQESWLLDTMTWYGTAMTRLKSHQIMPTTKSTTQENPKS